VGINVVPSGGFNRELVDAKGDIIAATAADTVARVAVGANNLVLTADSAEATGLKWAAPDPLTTKGDLFTYSTTEARIGVGANDTVLTADSSTATGLKWATPASGGMTLISSGSIGSGFTVSSIPGTYNELVFIFSNLYRTTSYNSLLLQFNGSASNNYNWLRADQGTTAINQGTNTGGMCANYGTNPSTGVCRIPGYATSGGGKIWHWNSTNVNNTGASAGLGSGIKYDTTAAITSITILADSSTVGSYQLFGVK
jgi:hypothetical protein